MSLSVDSWSTSGAEEQPIFGATHVPQGEPRGIIVIAHGFKGYKDYGMFPRIASECAKAGLIVHRFNFSHSGMTNNIDTFERPDLFERDTWNKQVLDLAAVVRAAIGNGQSAMGGSATLQPIADSRLPIAESLPCFLFGHSRGGVTAILTAGRFADDPDFPQPAGIITAAAPSTACSLSEEDQQRLLREGYLDSPSSRTGQHLRIGKAFLQEQLGDPEGHDVFAMAGRIKCPMLIIHGENDPTVPVSAAHELAQAAGSNARTHIIPGGDHVFNTPNPLPEDRPASEQLATLIRATVGFAREICERQ
jgi:uncharacterized protein